jgi:hypothetical protein
MALDLWLFLSPLLRSSGREVISLKKVDSLVIFEYDGKAKRVLPY